MASGSQGSRSPGTYRVGNAQMPSRPRATAARWGCSLRQGRAAQGWLVPGRAGPIPGLCPGLLRWRGKPSVSPTSSLATHPPLLHPPTRHPRSHPPTGLLRGAGLAHKASRQRRSAFSPSSLLNSRDHSIALSPPPSTSALCRPPLERGSGSVAPTPPQSPALVASHRHTHAAQTGRQPPAPTARTMLTIQLVQLEAHGASPLQRRPPPPQPRGHTEATQKFKTRQHRGE